MPSLSCPWFIAVAHPQGVWGLGGATGCSCIRLIPNCLGFLWKNSTLLPLFIQPVEQPLNSSCFHLDTRATRGLFEVGQRNRGSHSPHIGKPIDPHWGSVVEEACGTCPHLCPLPRPEGHRGMGRAADQRSSLKTGGVRPFQWTFLITGGAERSRDLVIWKLLPREKRTM